MKKVISFVWVVLLLYSWNLFGPETGTVIDYDGNTYKTVLIGDQWWMTENLKTTHFRNGDPIPRISDNTAWGQDSLAAYCLFDNSDSLNCLYNWHAVNDSLSIAPEGWHIPNDSEWQILVEHIGGDRVAGDMLKSKNGWGDLDEGNNDVGFNALPTGYRHFEGDFIEADSTVYYWSSTLYTEGTWSKAYGLKAGQSEIIAGFRYQNSGFSVRCVKDAE